MGFLSDLIDKNNSKEPKAFVGIMCSVTLCGTTAIYHTDVMIYTLGAVIAGALAFSLGETISDNIKKGKVPPQNDDTDGETK